MAIVVVQVGQCGIQVGGALFRGLAACTKGQPSPFFDVDGRARTVLVDAEPRVVKAATKNCPLFCDDQCVWGHSGAGNNWGVGYNGLNNASHKKVVNGPAKSQSPPRFQIATEQKRSDNDLAGRALRAIHREASRVGDGALEAFVVVHSLGGGTGSGLGSRLVELLRRYYTFNSLRDDDTDAEWLAGEYGERHRALYVVSVCVTPLMSGEIPVQSMNATLTLSSISRSCDAVIMIRNDDFVLDLQLDDGMAKVNERIVQLLLPVLRFGRSCGIIGDLISYCCPDPRRAFLTLLPFDDKAAHRLSGFYASALASRLYAVADSHDAASSMPEVPVQSLHVQWSAAIAPATCSQCLVRPPRDCASCPSVLVLNQMKELSKRTLFPLVSSCYQKLEVGAYRDTFEAAGVTPTFIKRAVRCVSELVARYDTSSSL